MPRHLRTLDGLGALLDGDSTISTVSYELKVWQEPNGLTRATAAVETTGASLATASIANNLSLRLASGDVLPAIFRRGDPAQLELLINEPVLPVQA